MAVRGPHLFAFGDRHGDRRHQRRQAGANPLNSPSQVLRPMLGARYRERYAVMTDVDGVTREDSLPGWGNDGTNFAEYRERSWPGWRAS